YLIDKHANLRTLELNNGVYHQFENEYMSNDVMRRMYDESDATEKLDPVVVAEMLKKSYRLANDESAELTNEDRNVSNVYLGFKRNHSNNVVEQSTDDCSSDYLGSNLNFLQTLIYAEGSLSGQNSDEETIELLTWLRAVTGEDLDSQGK
ncbi:MAG: hypothetical protein AAFO82_18520, partial [Bacteroidota bacterium]